MEKQGEMDNLKKTGGQFCENSRIKWTGFIRGQTGFIRRWTGFIRRADEASPPADEASPPMDEASPIGPYFFFFSLLKCLLFV